MKFHYPIITILWVIAGLTSLHGQTTPCVVNVDRTTSIVGYIDYTEDELAFTTCRFLDLGTGYHQVYSPGEIFGYNVIGKREYRSAQVGRVKYFARLLYVGRIILGVTPDGFVAGLPGDTLQELTMANKDSLLTAWFPQCVKLQAKMRHTKLTRSALYNLFRKSETCGIVDSSKHITLSPGVYAGLDYSNPVLGSTESKSALLEPSMKDLFPLTAGVQISLMFPRISKAVGINLGAFYRPQHFSSLYQVTGTSHELDLSYTEIRLPANLQIQVYQSITLAGYITAGVSFSFTNQLKSSSTLDTSPSPGVIYQEVYENPVKTLTKVPQAQLGYTQEFKFWKKSKLQLNLSYLIGSGRMEFQETTKVTIPVTYNSLLLLVAYHF